MNAEQCRDVLTSIASRLSQLDENGWVESVALSEISDFITTQEKALQAYARIRAAIAHANAERTGAYFICGGSELDERLGVPEQVEICPAFGSDVVYVYKRTDKRITPQW